jgi:hypothetical protein
MKYFYKINALSAPSYLRNWKTNDNIKNISWLEIGDDTLFVDA